MFVRCRATLECSNVGCPRTPQGDGGGVRPPTRALCVAAATPAPQTGCALLPASCRVGGFALGRWGGSHATPAREDVGVALRRGGLARTPRAMPPPRLPRHCACALLPASWGVGASPWGARVAAPPHGRGAAPGTRACKPSPRRRRPSCLDCTWALLPASWEVGASPSIYYLYIIRI